MRRRCELVAVEPQVFDLLIYLLTHRDRVVSKDDLFASVWAGRVVSDSTLTSRINAARKAIGDSGEDQKLIRTVARKGFRFVGFSPNQRGGRGQCRCRWCCRGRPRTPRGAGDRSQRMNVPPLLYFPSPI